MPHEGEPFRLPADEFRDHPYSLYVPLREDEPVREVITPTGLHAWLVTRYDDVRALLSDPRLTKDAEHGRRVLGVHGPDTPEAAQISTPMAAHMLNTEPPDHTRLRRLVNKAFAARDIERLRPRVAEITAELLDAIEPDDEVDLVAALAFPLPIKVISELLGIPGEDAAKIHSWSEDLVTGSTDKVASAGPRLGMYLYEVIERKRVEPADDLLTALIKAEEDGDRLNELELISMAALLLVAGYETTIGLIGNGVLALLHHPEQLAALRADPSLLPGAVEELLRYDGPTNVTLRFTTEPVTVGAHEIPADSVVLVAHASANRDGERFAEPDRLDVTRTPAGHLTFGHGIHYCVGAPLARLEGEIAIGALLERFPKITLAADLTTLRYRPGTIVRALETLPVRLGRV
ncbi:cytochrome P450 [Herbihabitans rhizosphaerae]|uniref:Cytochrome P450 n=1 Tax=Herbihabitans rhizosphaerae TaxID=1872711 RepID=A0A4Q7KHT1_9PSEU|nr:cytochrome P450 [Herbihabitans rhizosphaerae]RZS34852.1 cytochrome P450 [Herbihabitans rhizosphaerae]